MAIGSAELERRLSGQTWTSHNVALGDGLTTIPGREDFLTEDLRLLAIERSLGALMGSDLAGRRVLDLGSLEGGFAAALALRGAKVTAIEALPANIAKIELLRDHLELHSLEIVEEDVKDVTVERFGSFDVVLALGILYHLDQPVSWLKQVAALTRSVLFLDTHIAPSDDTGLDRLREDLRHLGPIEVQLDGGSTYAGRWFSEFPPTIADASRAEQLWASWSNDRSFWLTEEALLHALDVAGFALVYEQHDLTSQAYRTFKHEFPRALYVCAPPPGAEDRP